MKHLLELIPALASVVASGIAAYLAYKAADRSSKRQERTQEVVSEKATASSNLETWTQQVAARLTKVEDDNEELRARVAQLEEELRKERSLFDVAVDFIRYLLVRLGVHDEHPEVPTELKAAVGPGHFPRHRHP